MATTERMGVDPLAYGVVEREGGPIVALQYDEEGAVEWMANARSEYRNQQCPSPSYRLIKLVDRAAVAELVAAIPRAIEMLRVAGLHCDLYGSDATSVYDEAVCDGTCIQMDCTDAADSLAAALAPFSEAGR